MGRTKLGELLSKYKYVVLVLLIGIGLMLIPDGDRKSEVPAVSEVERVSDQTKELTELLSQIQGA